MLVASKARRAGQTNKVSYDILEKTIFLAYRKLEPTMNSSKLYAENIKKTFIQAEKPLEVLKGISINFEQGKTYAITGASGSGKSTLLHILGGLDTPTTGKVSFNDQEISGQQTNRKFLNTSIGFVFQFHYLVNELTCAENIMLMGMINNQPKKKVLDRAKKLLKQVGLKDKAHSYPFELSGGEQQRIAILRAIFNKPDFLLADEPTGNLDAKNAESIIKLLLDCKDEWKMGIILCSHDEKVYKKMENIFELGNGKCTPVRPE
jgi:ABC-type lipoprotein export system ATPase subunit